MKETFYFSHDYHAREDEKIMKMVAKNGWEAYGIFWAIIEKLYEEGGLLEKDYSSLAFALRTDSERIANVVESGLFEFRNEKFYSKSVNARLVKRKGKSEMARQSANLRWSKPKKTNANALRTECDGNAIKESKVKESKHIAETSSAPEAPFNQDQWLESLAENKSRAINLIGYYFKEKKVSFPSKKAANAEMVRWLKDANIIIEYDEQKIVKALKSAREKYPDWKLSAVKKELPNIK